MNTTTPRLGVTRAAATAALLACVGGAAWNLLITAVPANKLTATRLEPHS